LLYSVEHHIIKDYNNNMEETCSICREIIGEEKTYTTCCRHVFHDSCIQTWKTFQVRSRRSCPLCRTRLARLVVRPVQQNNDIITYNNCIIMFSVVCFILYLIQSYEEINDNGICQWDAKQWCKNQGYTWFKAVNNGGLCNIDYCYRYPYTYI